MEQPVLDDIINQLLEVRGRPGKQVQLSESEIRQHCGTSREIFLQQPNLLDLQAPIKICGTTFFPIPTFCFSVLFSKFCFFWFLVWEIRCGFVLIGSFLGYLFGNFLTNPDVFLFLIFGSVSVLGVFHLILSVSIVGPHEEFWLSKFKAHLGFHLILCLVITTMIGLRYWILFWWVLDLINSENKAD